MTRDDMIGLYLGTITQENYSYTENFPQINGIGIGNMIIT